MLLKQDLNTMGRRLFPRSQNDTNVPETSNDKIKHPLLFASRVIIVPFSFSCMLFHVVCCVPRGRGGTILGLEH
jgi:hypothetical protein